MTLTRSIILFCVGESVVQVILDQLHLLLIRCVSLHHITDLFLGLFLRVHSLEVLEQVFVRNPVTLSASFPFLLCRV